MICELQRSVHRNGKQLSRIPNACRRLCTIIHFSYHMSPPGETIAIMAGRLHRLMRRDGEGGFLWPSTFHHYHQVVMDISGFLLKSDRSFSLHTLMVFQGKDYGEVRTLISIHDSQFSLRIWTTTKKLEKVMHSTKHL